MIMKNLISKTLAGLLLAACLVVIDTPANAHGSLTMDEDRCKLRIGRYLIHFAGFQPFDEKDPYRFREFCEDIPAVGQTFVVLDLVDQELRALPISVRVLRNLGPGKDDIAPVVFEMPKESHPTGSFSYRHTFNEPGQFIGVITAGTGDDQIEARFPFSVGGSPPLSIWSYAFAALMIIVGLGILIRYALSRHDKALKKAGL